MHLHLVGATGDSELRKQAAKCFYITGIFRAGFSLVRIVVPSVNVNHEQHGIVRMTNCVSGFSKLPAIPEIAPLIELYE